MTVQNYSKEVPSNPDLLPEIEEFVIDTIQHIGLSEEKMNNLALSVAEAASNGIMHGNKCDESKKLKINILIEESLITVKFKDEGEGFIPASVPDPTAPENILKDHGRGLHIMKTFLDSLEYNFLDNGTEVVLKLKY